MRALLAVLIPLLLATFSWAEEKLNVLFIAVDDLRPELGCYGKDHIKSPHVDGLAAEGLVFNRAYCQQAVCSPSRTSLMTGRRPDTTQVFDLNTHFRDKIPDVVTLSQYFKQNGYHSEGMGKIYHGGFDDKLSWSVPHRNAKEPRFGPKGQAVLAKLRREARMKGVNLKKARIRGLPYEAPEVKDTELRDGGTASMAVETLQRIKDKPFFLAVGFLNPHLPFVAPKKYWDLYDHDKVQPAENDYPPKSAPPFALTNWGELRQYVDIPKSGPVSDEQAKNLVHGYYAAVSYIDAQIGRLLEELDRLKLREKTVVIVWGDHGWQLREHGMWCKHTNFETSTRVPLIISVPGAKTKGGKTDALVEFVDIYPSLVDICGLKMPEGLEGTNFKPLLEDPSKEWKKAALSQYPRTIRGVGRGMGYSMRTDRYRFTEWRVPGKDFRAYELYDHETDPQENVNLARRPRYKELVEKLTKELHEGWKPKALVE